MKSFGQNKIETNLTQACWNLKRIGKAYAFVFNFITLSIDKFGWQIVVIQNNFFSIIQKLINKSNKDKN